jgi:4-amino-4-deoxy-L-arabinose transferase-like glycosyltransferase
MAFVGAVMFDMLLACAVLLAALNVARAAAHERGAWAWVGLALGLGILAKGPVMLLHTVPLILLAPWWASPPSQTPAVRWSAWYRRAALALLMGVAIALAWAVPAALVGGPAFFEEIFWRQSVDRMVKTLYHPQPFWFYALYFPILVFPWLFFPAVWRAFGALARSQRSRAARFALAWLVPTLIGFSLFRSKQLIYLTPELPALALLAAVGLSQMKSNPRRWEFAALALLIAASAIALAIGLPGSAAPLVSAGERPLVLVTVAVWLAAAAIVLCAPRRSAVAAVAAIGTASVLIVLGGYAGIGLALADSFDVRPIAHVLGEAQRDGAPIAHVGKYHGQFQFAGRLQRPIEVVENADAAFRWAEANPLGSVIVQSRSPLTHPSVQPQAWSQLQGHFVYVWRAQDLRGVSNQWYRAPIDESGTAGASDSLRQRG